MAISKIGYVLPRLKISAGDIGSVWGDQTVFGYESIRKLGYDEDGTTLAVTCYNLFREKPSKLIIYGPVNSTIFEEAVDLSSKAVEFHEIHSNSTSIFSKFEELKESVNTALIIVSTPYSSDPKSEAILSSGAIIFHFNSRGIQLKVFETGQGSKELVPRYSSQELNLVTDHDRIDVQKNLIKSGTVVLTSSDLRVLQRSSKKIMFSNQKATGFSDYLSPFAELTIWASTVNSGEKIRIINADSRQSKAINFEMSSDVTVKIHDQPTNFVYSKYLQKSNFIKNNNEMSQGAYISEPIYNAASSARFRLQANICTLCNAVEFPPRRRCKQCGGKTKEGPELEKEGILYSFTKILKGAAPTEFDPQQMLEGEYSVGIIKFNSGPKVITQLSDVKFEELKIGDKMKMVFRKIYNQDDKPRYGYKFIKPDR